MLNNGLPTVLISIPATLIQDYNWNCCQQFVQVVLTDMLQIAVMFYFSIAFYCSG